MPMTDPLVLLPGMMCDARLFLPQIVALSCDTTVQVAPITLGATIDEIAKDVIAQAPATFALAGLSMGGVVAMEVLRRVPERITRLALMDTNCQNEPANIAAAREAAIIGARSGRLAGVMRDEIKPACLAPGAQRQEVLSIVMDMALDLGPEVFVRQSRALQRRPDQQATLRRAKTPTLVLCGEYDTLCPVRRHEFIAHLMPNAQLQVIPDAGHLPPLENPDVVTAMLRRWLCAPSASVF